tara:strand:- start:443 stop:940 length:498 start_codon:yes stop_codon:yes gene_type:complete
MKNALFAIALLFIISCNNTPQTFDETKKISSEISEKMTFYGTEISLENISNYESEKVKTFQNGLTKTKLSGEIVETCQKKGCWMSLNTGTDTVFVRFRDYGFFVPTDSVNGKTAIIEGELFIDTISVKMLKHYAEDGGKSEEEIALITEPSYDLNFTADGVIIKD